MDDVLSIPPEGLSLERAEDPQGAGQESYRLVFRPLGTTTVYRTGDYYQLHGGQKIRGVSAPSPESCGEAFELDPADSRVIRVE